MPNWLPPYFVLTSVPERLREWVAWDRATLHPLHALPQGLEYCDTPGILALDDYATFLESGRVIILYGEEHGLTVPGTSFVLARISIDFLGEMHWPGEVEIGTAVSRVGNSSIGLDQALFVDGRCVATAENTLVLLDKATRKPRPFTPEHAARIAAAAPKAPGPG